jgi:hypothetical protein
MQLQSSPHRPPAARQSQYLLLHRVFRQLHLAFFPFCFFLPAKICFSQFLHSKQLQLSLQTFPYRKHRQYSFKHPLLEQLQNILSSNIGFLSCFLKDDSRFSNDCSYSTASGLGGFGGWSSWFWCTKCGRR